MSALFTRKAPCNKGRMAPTLVRASGVVKTPWSASFLLSFLSAEFRGEGRVVEIFPPGSLGKSLGYAFRANAKSNDRR